MTHPYNKQDIFKGELTAAERLEPARATIRFAIQLLEQFNKTIDCASDLLTENQLETICKAADMAKFAAMNCAFMGHSNFTALPLERVEWQNS